MSRPTNKVQLEELAQENYQKLMTLVESFSPSQQAGKFPFEDRDKNIRDVLIHLYEWHQLLLNWEKSNLQGVPCEFLRAGFNWKTYPQMNIEFWQEHQKTGLDEAKKMLQKSHQQVLKIIAAHSEDELFVKKYYPWTGTSSLGAYCISATSSHYDWALKKIKRYQKELLAMA